MADPGQGFLGWSGDATGTQPQISVTVNQAKVITAQFSSHVTLSASKPGLEGFFPEGFRLTVAGDLNAISQIQGSTNFVLWDLLGRVTNSLPEIQFTDPAALTLPWRFYRAQPWP